MDDSTKVFSSMIMKSEQRQKNDLYDLIHIEPARPLQNIDYAKNNNACDFTPKTDKCYIPKRKYHRRKVKTVSDIKKDFEQETYLYLNSYLERQESILLKKISCGLSGEEDTKTLAKNVLKTDEPISRSSWQMLININPDNHINPKQFVIYDEKYIQVNGSLGGKRKLICNYDLALKKNPVKKKCFSKDQLKKSKGLLRNSLDVKFKPGPLGMKRFLDDSHQKYHVGEIALVDLPKPGLDIQPTYGCALDPSITYFLNNLRQEDGTIAPKWAEFAVSVLGTMENSDAVMMSKDCVTFSLNYKYDQGRILMRRDFDNKFKKVQPKTTKNSIIKNQAIFLPEIKNIMNEILDSVEISITQDDMYNTDEDFVDNANEILSLDERNMGTSAQRDRNKNRYGELGRLDVTVISIPDVTEENINHTCKKSFCLLGCICHSLATSYNLKYHCGRVECMFECTCDFASYKTLDSSDTNCSDLMPAIANIDRAINIKLAKEEQKFHQTVILKGHKSILLKSEKRNWKASKKYADFYSTMCLKNERQKMLDLAIVSPKLDCRNIEPLCMVHNLYKCFCKGKFLDTFGTDLIGIESNVISDNKSFSEDLSKTSACQENTVLNKRDRNSSSTSTVNYDKEYGMDTTDVGSIKANKTILTRSTNRNLRKVSYARITDSRLLMKRNSVSENIENKEEEYYDETCSRVNAYKGRKFTDGYYKNTNTKIYEMEKNDKTLQQRLLATVKHFDALDKSRENKIFVPASINPKETYSTQTLDNDGKSFDSVPETSRAGVNLSNESGNSTMQVETESDKKEYILPKESKLVTWLVANYQKFKEHVGKGKAILHPPVSGKIAIHSWDFILQRYRERKNMFLITKQKPFHIYLAIDAIDPFFKNCININEIRYENLNKYPQTVKNLITYTTEYDDNFCVLRGLQQCWEFVGLITKIEDENKEMPQNRETTGQESAKISHTESSDTDEYKVSPIDPKKDAVERFDGAETSKWFVMTVENDFTEIRFYRKGFFVKYESIVKATNVARLSGKTVRLSSTKCMENSNSPQFGIYAIPNNYEHCVFVGPYEINDNLGIECIRSALSVGSLLKRTRGFWLKTNKVENDNVITNPMSFMITDQKTEVDLLENLISIQNKNENVSPKKAELTENLQGFYKSQPNKSDSSKNTNLEDHEKHGIVTKSIIKPIKISKTNASFHFRIPKLPKLNTIAEVDNHDVSEENQRVSITKSSPLPLLEDATSQIKIIDVFSMQKDEIKVTSPSNLDAENVNKFVNIDKDSPSKVEIKPETKASELGMFILKPEEINRKMLQMKMNREDTSEIESDSYRFDSILKRSLSDTYDDAVEDISDGELNLDIDNFCQINVNQRSVGVNNPTVENDNENDVSDMTEDCGSDGLTNISGECSNSFLDNTKINTINQSFIKRYNADMNRESQNSSNEDCYILSDDDDDKEIEQDNGKVYLESSIGWVEAYINDYGLISFKLGDSENSKYYSKEALPEVLNTALYKKIFNTESEDAELCLEWKLVTKKINLSQKKIDNANLSSYKMKLMNLGLIKSEELLIKPAAARAKKKGNAKQLSIDKKTRAEPVRTIRTYSKINRMCTTPSTVTTIVSSDDEEFVEEQDNVHARLSPNDDTLKDENMATRRTPEPAIQENKDCTPGSPNSYLLEERMEVEYLQDSLQGTDSEKTDSSDEDEKELDNEEDKVP